jgi:hypothetical protein
MRQIDLATLLEQLDHGGRFPLEDAVDRIAARRLVVETAGGVALLPSPHPLPIELARWPALARVLSHRTGIRPARDRLSTRTRCRPDSALFRPRNNADCSDIVIVPTCARMGPPGQGNRREKVGTIRGRQGERVAGRRSGSGAGRCSIDGLFSAWQSKEPAQQQVEQLHAVVLGLAMCSVLHHRRGARRRQPRSRIVPTYPRQIPLPIRHIRADLGTITTSEQSAVGAHDPNPRAGARREPATRGRAWRPHRTALPNVRTERCRPGRRDPPRTAFHCMCNEIVLGKATPRMRRRRNWRICTSTCA